MNIIMSRAFHHQYHHRPSNPPVCPTSPVDFTERIPFKELYLSNETLGSGSFGTVYKGEWRGRSVAIKKFTTEIKSFLVEVKQLSSIRHDNIVKLYGTSQPRHDTAYLIMEYAEGGSLNHLLHECIQQNYDLRHACRWAMQTAKGVAYLHGLRPKPIMHRDLKPANLLLFSRGKILKICDFGTACQVKTNMTNNTGSAAYMAPEVFATSSYLESGDVFSWSIIFWEILARHPPFNNPTQKYSNAYQIMWHVTQHCVRPTELEDCPKIIWDLITQCWAKEPKKRPTMQEVVERMQFVIKFTETKSNSNDQHPDHTSHPHARTNPTRSLSSCGTGTTAMSDDARRLKIRSEALKHLLDLLRERKKELEQTRCDKITAMATLDEIEQLKEVCEKRKAELKQKQMSSSHTSNNYSQSSSSREKRDEEVATTLSVDVTNSKK